MRLWVRVSEESESEETMTVDELIEVLRHYSPSAEVIISLYGRELYFDINQTPSGNVIIDAYEDDDDTC